MINLRFPSLLKNALVIAVAFTCRAFGAVDSGAPFDGNIEVRGSLTNSRIRFEREKKGTVAFMGGSITEMNGYRPKVCDLLKKRFPATDFNFVDAGIASTGSTTGAFRLVRDVFSQGRVDLFFIEFAVNDDQDEMLTREESIRGMEGIIRHARRINPDIDIVITYFVNESMLKTLQSGETPLTIAAHDTVAKHYDVSAINLAKEVAAEITGGSLTWQKYGGVHPAPYGNAIGARMIGVLFDRVWADSLASDAAIKPHPMPAPLDPLSYSDGRFISPKEAQIKNGWTLETPDWKNIPGSKRPRFTSIPMLCATQPGAEVSLSFEGTSAGAYVVAGPDAGMLEVTIDAGAPHTVNLLHHFSAGLHYPRTVMLGTGLKPGKHILTLRISPETKSGGHAARIIEFAAN